MRSPPFILPKSWPPPMAPSGNSWTSGDVSPQVIAHLCNRDLPLPDYVVHWLLCIPWQNARYHSPGQGGFCSISASISSLDWWWMSCGTTYCSPCHRYLGCWITNIRVRRDITSIGLSKGGRWQMEECKMESMMDSITAIIILLVKITLYDKKKSCL